MTNRFDGVSDESLESALISLVREERERTADLLEHLAEFDRRALPTSRGRSSLWSYCTMTLGYSHREAWDRVQACRAAAKAKRAYELLRAGRIQLSGLAVLNAHLRPENADVLLKQAEGKSVREIEVLLAAIAPRPDRPDRITTLSAPKPPPTILAPSSAQVESRAEDLPLFSTAQTHPVVQESRVHFGFTGSGELRDKIDRARQLLFHKFPQGRLEDVIGQALEDLLDKRDPDRQKERRRPAIGADGSAAKLSPEAAAAHRRYIPLWVRADVWKRDGGCCAFTTSDGVRCGETSGLEYDHVVPWALGGPSDEPDNIRLLCRAHNQLLARECFGPPPQRRANA